MAPVIGVTYGYDVGDDCTNNYIRAVRDHGVSLILCIRVC